MEFGHNTYHAKMMKDDFIIEEKSNEVQILSLHEVKSSRSPILQWTQIRSTNLCGVHIVPNANYKP